MVFDVCSGGGGDWHLDPKCSEALVHHFYILLGFRVTWSSSMLVEFQRFWVGAQSLNIGLGNTVLAGDIGDDSPRLSGVYNKYIHTYIQTCIYIYTYIQIYIHTYIQTYIYMVPPHAPTFSCFGF